MKLRRLWAALRDRVAYVAPRLDLREVLVSFAVGWFAVAGLEAVTGPLPALLTSAVGLAVSLIMLFAVIPLVIRR
jgi:hypothetical protein